MRLTVGWWKFCLYTKSKRWIWKPCDQDQSMSVQLCNPYKPQVPKYLGSGNVHYSVKYTSDDNFCDSTRRRRTRTCQQVHVVHGKNPWDALTMFFIQMTNLSNLGWCILSLRGGPTSWMQKHINREHKWGEGSGHLELLCNEITVSPPPHYRTTAQPHNRTTAQPHNRTTAQPSKMRLKISSDHPACKCTMETPILCSGTSWIFILHPLIIIQNTWPFLHIKLLPRG